MEKSITFFMTMLHAFFARVNPLSTSVNPALHEEHEERRKTDPESVDIVAQFMVRFARLRRGDQVSRRRRSAALACGNDERRIKQEDDRPD